MNGWDRQTILEKVIALVAKRAGKRPEGLTDDHLVGELLDSLDTTQLVFDLQEEFEIDIPPEKVVAYEEDAIGVTEPSLSLIGTVGDIAGYVAKRLGVTA